MRLFTNVRMSRGGSGSGVPMSIGRRISRPNTSRSGVKPVDFGRRRAVRLEDGWQKRLPVVRATLNCASQHCYESAIESLALSIRLGAVGRRSSFVDAESDAQLFEQCDFELRAAIRVNLLRGAVPSDPLGVDGASDCLGALVVNWESPQPSQ